MNIYIKLLFLIIIVGFLSVSLKTILDNYVEGFRSGRKLNNMYDKGLYLDYNKNIFPIKKHITKEEHQFIIRWMDKISINDVLNDPHISTVIISIIIHKNGKMNKSRLAIGTKTKHKAFKKEVLQLLKNMNIYHELPSNFKYYGIGWDIEDELLKLYGLNEDNSKIICYVFNIKRDNNKVIESTYESQKTYNVNKYKTVMLKNGKKVEQINIKNNLPKKYFKDYPKAEKLTNVMNKNGYTLDTYSEYDNKLTLYFD